MLELAVAREAEAALGALVMREHTTVHSLSKSGGIHAALDLR